MRYDPSNRADLSFIIGIIKGIWWLISTPFILLYKWLRNKKPL